MKKIYLIVLVLLVIGVGGYFLLGRGVSAPDSSQEPLTVSFTAGESSSFKKGEKAPDLTLTDFEGGSHKISDYSGKAVVLDFWAAWCPFCVAEMPELQKAHEKYGDELVMIGVHRTDTEQRSTGENFAIDRGVSYLLVSDDGSLYNAAGGFGMPVAVFIDKEGMVVEIKSGAKTAAEIEEKIGKLVTSNK